MARSQHTYAKRQREIEKKRKADEKRARRLARKQGGADATEQEPGAEGESGADLEQSPTQVSEQSQ